MTTKFPSVKTRSSVPQYNGVPPERGIQQVVNVQQQQLPPPQMQNTLVQQQQVQRQTIPAGYYAQVQMRPVPANCMQIHHLGLIREQQVQQEKKEDHKEL